MQGGSEPRREVRTKSWLDRQVVGWIHANGTQIVICGVVVVHFLARQAGRQPQPEYQNKSSRFGRIGGGDPKASVLKQCLEGCSSDAYPSAG